MKPTKNGLSISPDEQELYMRTQKELFNETEPRVFVKKETQPITDPNEACYIAIATWVYGFPEYSAKIDFVTDINYTRKNFNCSMLQESISTNFKIDVAEDLIQRGIDVNNQDFRGNTALHYLAQKTNKPGAIRLLEKILDNGANVNLLNKEGQSALWLIVHSAGVNPSEEQRAIIKKMVSMGAKKEILPSIFQECLDSILGENNLY